jgi:hypothetical protein
MSEISGNSLFVLVQVLDEKVTALKLKIEQTSAEDPSIADWEEELLTYSVVAIELRTAYEKAAAEAGNLPAYDTLVRIHSRL